MRTSLTARLNYGKRSSARSASNLNYPVTLLARRRRRGAVMSKKKIICKRCPNRFLSVILTISGYLIVFCSVRCENRSFRDSVIAKLRIFCSSSASDFEKTSILVNSPHFARFTDRSGRNKFCIFERSPAMVSHLPSVGWSLISPL